MATQDSSKPGGFVSWRGDVMIETRWESHGIREPMPQLNEGTLSTLIFFEGCLAAKF